MVFEPPGGGGSFPSEIRNAADFSGADGGAQIQNAINDLPGHGVVVVGPEGPDDVSGSTADFSDIPTAMQQNAWQYSSAISVPSYVTVIAHNALIFQSAGSDTHAFRNSDETNGNADIRLLGQNAIIHWNIANNTTSVDGVNGGWPIRMFNVDRLTIEGFRIRNSASWSIALLDVTDASCGHIRIDQNNVTNGQDGIHVVGPSDDIDLYSFHGTSGDDFFTIDNGGGTSANVGGAVSGVSIRGFNVNVNTYALLKTVGGGSGEISDISIGPGSFVSSGDVDIKLGAGDNISISGVNGEAGAAFVQPTADGVSDISIADCNIDGGTGIFWSPGGHDVSGLKISNCSYHRGSGKADPGVLNFGGNATITDVTVQNFTITHGGAATPRRGIAIGANGSSTTLDSALFDGIILEGMDEGVAIGGSASVSDVRFANVQFRANNSTRWNLSQQKGILINGKSPRTNIGGLGTYTGDGTQNRTILLGFTPTYVAVRGSDGTWYDIHADFGEGFDHSVPTGELNIVTDGFQVGDNDGDADPNTDTETYTVLYEA